MLYDAASAIAAANGADQPLDATHFQQYKHQFRSHNDRVQRCEASVSTKSAFFRYIPQVREKTLSRRVIRHSFKERGIYPFDPSEVIQPLVDRLSPEPPVH